MEASPSRAKADRYQEYEVRITDALRHGPGRRDRFSAASLVVLLTGRKEELRIARNLPGTSLRTEWEGGLRCLETEDAEAILEGVNGGRLARSVLMWLPLMRGGNDPTNI